MTKKLLLILSALVLAGCGTAGSKDTGDDDVVNEINSTADENGGATNAASAHTAAENS